MTNASGQVSVTSPPSAPTPTTRMLPARASTRSPWLSLGGLVVIGVAGVLAPVALYGGSDYGFNLMLSVVIWGGLAVSWNMFSGLTRYLSLGHAAFFGAGAYSVALLQPRVGPWLALAGAAVVAGLIGLVLGVLTLRLRGLFFTMATIGIAEVLRLTVLLTPGRTGGGTGLTLAGLPTFSTIYYVAVGGLILLVAVMLWLMTSVHGARLVAIRDDEEALGATGVAVNRYKIVTFGLSVMAGGFFGGVYTLQIGFVQPDAVFPLLVSLTVVIMCLLGGMGTLWGPLLGAVVLSLLREELWVRYPTVWDLGLGFVLIVIVVAMPGGLIGFLRDRFGRLNKHVL